MNGHLVMAMRMVNFCDIKCDQSRSRECFAKGDDVRAAVYDPCRCVLYTAVRVLEVETIRGTISLNTFLYRTWLLDVAAESAFLRRNVTELSVWPPGVVEMCAAYAWHSYGNTEMLWKIDDEDGRGNRVMLALDGTRNYLYCFSDYHGMVRIDPWSEHFTRTPLAHIRRDIYSIGMGTDDFLYYLFGDPYGRTIHVGRVDPTTLDSMSHEYTLETTGLSPKYKHVVPIGSGIAFTSNSQSSGRPELLSFQTNNLAICQVKRIANTSTDELHCFRILRNSQLLPTRPFYSQSWCPRYEFPLFPTRSREEHHYMESKFIEIPSVEVHHGYFRHSTVIRYVALDIRSSSCLILTACRGFILPLKNITVIERIRQDLFKSTDKSLSPMWITEHRRNKSATTLSL